MSLQSIINVCESIEINRRKVAGVQFTRSEIPKISSTPTRNPWKFSLNITAGLQYSDNRALIEEIDRLDRINTEVVSFSGVPGQSFLFKYQGIMTQAQRNAVRVNDFVGTTLTLGTLPSVGAGELLFKKGDLIQIGNLPHPFSVTADVPRGTLGSVSITVHRPNFLTTYIGQGIKVGNEVQFKVFSPNMPSYRLIPGGKDALIEWTSEFQLYEDTGAQ